MKALGDWCRECRGTGGVVETVGHEPSGPDDPGCHEEEFPCPSCNGTGLKAAAPAEVGK